MKSHEEIAKVAHELYEKSGRAGGRDLENWLEAERLVKAKKGDGNGKERATEEAEHTAPAKRTTVRAGAKKTETKKTEPKKTGAKRTTRAKKSE